MILKVTRLPKDKDRQVEITIHAMIRLVVNAQWNKYVRWCADRALIGTFPRTLEELDAMTRFVRAHMVFLLDPKDVELIRVPAAMAREIRYAGRSWGDCDDYALLLASMLQARGWQNGFVTMATSPHNPEFRHVFNIAIGPHGRAVPLDATLDRPYDTGPLRTREWWIRSSSQPPAI